jgi:DNA-binding transcriptional ArsR family regulator
MTALAQWFLFSSHDSVLLHIAANPDCTINEIADAMALTPRTVSRTMRDLSRAGVIYIRKNGGQPRYAVNLDCLFLHPSIKGYTLRYVLGQMAEQGQLLMAAAYLDAHGGGA